MPKTKKSNKIKLKPFLFVILLLMAVVFTSGCVLQQYWPVFGSDVIKISRSQQTLGTNNVLVVGQKYTLPEKVVLPDSNMQLYVVVQDKDTDATKYANNMFIDLFDASVFKGVKTVNGKTQAVLCNTDRSYCQPDNCGKASPCKMAMGAEKPITFALRSPTLDEIAGIKTDVKLYFKVSYDYSGSSSYEVLVVDYNEILRRQRAGESLSTSLSEISGSGPIKIDVSQRIPFITTSSDGIIIFQIKDTGNGELKGSNITKGNLRIEFPRSLVPDLTHLQGDIVTGTSGAGGGTTAKKCGVTPGYYCVSGEQKNNCLEDTGLGTGASAGCAENEKCCVTCESKGNNCGGEPCVCTNNCISGSREPGERNCASGLKCCAEASSAATGQATVTGQASSTSITNYYYLCSNLDLSSLTCTNTIISSSQCLIQHPYFIDSYTSQSECQMDLQRAQAFYCDAAQATDGSLTLTCYNVPTHTGYIYTYIIPQDKTCSTPSNIIKTMTYESSSFSSPWIKPSWWDVTDSNGNIVPGGTYKYCVYPYHQKGYGEFAIVEGTLTVSSQPSSGSSPGVQSGATTPTQNTQQVGAPTTVSEPPTFKCELGSGDKQDKIICVNNKDIPLFKDQSESLWFKITNAPNIDVPHKSFYINANVSYTYELRDSVDIQVNPPTA